MRSRGDEVVVVGGRRDGGQPEDAKLLRLLGFLFFFLLVINSLVYLNLLYSILLYGVLVLHRIFKKRACASTGQTTSANPNKQHTQGRMLSSSSHYSSHYSNTSMPKKNKRSSLRS